MFNGKHYLQRVSTGTICTPKQAKVFLRSFELKYMYPLITGKCILYTSFIDDIFLIWNGTENELLDTITKFNTSHHSITFDLNYTY